MVIKKFSNSLEKSWERDDILLNIKNGSVTDQIINEYLVKNKRQIEELKYLLGSESIDLLNQVEELATCDYKINN